MDRQTLLSPPPPPPPPSILLHFPLYLPPPRNNTFALSSSKPPQREVLISMFYNNVVRLVKHTEAAEIVELAYNDYANAPQRALLVQEFYGPQFALFKDQSGRGLGEILADNPDQSSKLIGHMKQVLLPLMNKLVTRPQLIYHN